MNLRYMTALARVKPSITCYAGYCAVHLLCKYTTTLGFLPPHTRKSCQPCCQPCSALLIFSLYARVKPNTCFACAWFPSSLTKNSIRKNPDATSSWQLLFILLYQLSCALFRSCHHHTDFHMLRQDFFLTL